MFPLTSAFFRAARGFTVLLALFGALWAWAGPSPQEIAELPSTKKTLLNLYLYSHEVPDFLRSQKGHAVFVDVRSHDEAQLQGTPALCDANIPIDDGLHFAVPGESTDIAAIHPTRLSFTAQFDELLRQKHLGKNASIVLISNHGERSAMAANMLARHGYTLVYSVLDGYEGNRVALPSQRSNGWRATRLPIRYHRNPNNPASGDKTPCLHGAC
jgi:rhodanese-related sulfurtransferase